MPTLEQNTLSSQSELAPADAISLVSNLPASAQPKKTTDKNGNVTLTYGDNSYVQYSPTGQLIYSSGGQADTNAYQMFNPSTMSLKSGIPNTATSGTPFGIQNPSAIMSQFGTSTNPYTQAAQASTLGNLSGAQAATAANRVNQVTPYGELQYQQTGVDAQGNPIWSATQTLAPEFQGSFGNIARQVEQTTGQGFNPNLPSYGINPGETYSDAIMRRLQPQLQQQQERLDVQLANQGVMPGSEAYNRAKTQLGQQQSDQLTSAVVGGFNTGLAANQQAYNQALTNYQLPLATLNQFRTATAPSYVNPYSQAAVSGPDYLGAYNAQQNYNLGLQNAQAASNAGLTSGLFGLGTAALLNPSAVGSAYSTISSGLSKLNPFG